MTDLSAYSTEDLLAMREKLLGRDLSALPTEVLFRLRDQRLKEPKRIDPNLLSDLDILEPPQQAVAASTAFDWTKQVQPEKVKPAPKEWPSIEQGPDYPMEGTPTQPAFRVPEDEKPDRLDIAAEIGSRAKLYPATIGARPSTTREKISDAVDALTSHVGQLAYNRSLTGIIHEQLKGGPAFDLRGYRPGVVADVASQVLSFLMPADLVALAFGGEGVRIAKLGVDIPAGVARLTIGAAKEGAVEFLVKSGIERTVARETVKKAAESLGGRAVTGAVKSAGQLGTYSAAGPAIEGKPADQVFGSGFHGAALGLILGGAGEMSGAFGMKLSKLADGKYETLAKPIIKGTVLAGEVGAFAGGGALLENRMPNIHDFEQATAIVVGLKLSRLPSNWLKERVGEQLYRRVESGEAKNLEEAVEQMTGPHDHTVEKLAEMQPEEAKKAVAELSERIAKEGEATVLSETTPPGLMKILKDEPVAVEKAIGEATGMDAQSVKLMTDAEKIYWATDGKFGWLPTAEKTEVSGESKSQGRVEDQVAPNRTPVPEGVPERGGGGSPVGKNEVVQKPSEGKVKVDLDKNAQIGDIANYGQTTGRGDQGQLSGDAERGRIPRIGDQGTARPAVSSTVGSVDLGGTGAPRPIVVRDPTPAESESYVRNIESSVSGNPYKSQITIPKAADLKGQTVISSPDGRSGAIVKPTGEISHVYNNGRPVDGLDVFEQAVKSGGSWLSAYHTRLTRMYGQQGFRPVAKVPFDPKLAPEGWDYSTFKKWNNGKPDVVYMEYDGKPRSYAETAQAIKDLPYSERPPDLTKKGQTDITGKAPAEPQFTGLSKREIDRISEKADIEKLAPPDRMHFVDMVNAGKAGGHDVTALETAAEVIKSKRSLSKEEIGGMILKEGELEERFDIAKQDVADAIDRGDMAARDIAIERKNAIRDELATLIEGKTYGSREIARALALLQVGVDRNNEMAVGRLLTEAKVSKGRRLTPEESDYFTNLAAQYKEVEKSLNDALSKETAGRIEAERKLAEEVANREIRKARIRSKAAGTREKLDTELTDLKKQLVGLGYRMNDITGVTAEALYILGKIAVVHFQKGAANLTEVVKLMKADFPDLTDHDIWQGINTKDPKRQAKIRSETEKRVNRLKQQARVWTQFDNAQKGIFEAPGSKPAMPEDISNLQSIVRRLRNAAYRSGTENLEKGVQSLNELSDLLANLQKAVTEGLDTAPETAAIKEKITQAQKDIRVQDQIADLENQMATGDFKIKVKETPAPVSPEVERQQIKLKRLRLAARQRIDDLTPMTAGKVASDAANLLRTALTIADISATMRQGLVLSITSPRTALKAQGQALRAMFDRYTDEQINNFIHEHPNQFLRDRAGLDLSEISGKHTRREEYLSSTLAEKIPYYRQVVMASERHMRTFLNLLRVAKFDEFLENNPNATDAELKAVANWINVATGRGDIAKAPMILKGLLAASFAPRFSYSRLQTPYMLRKYWQLPRVRKIIAKDMAGLVGFGGAVLTLAALNGWESSNDPDDPDFGKIRIGNTHVDIWAGFQQPVRAILRVGKIGTNRLGWTESDQEASALEIVGRFAAFKLAPGVTLPIALLSGKDVMNRDITPTGAMANAVVPLFLQDAWDAYHQRGLGAAALVGAGSGLGIGVSTYEDSRTATARKIRRALDAAEAAETDELRKLQKEKAATLREDWNKAHPNKRIGDVRTTLETKADQTTNDIINLLATGDTEAAQKAYDKWNTANPKAQLDPMEDLQDKADKRVKAREHRANKEDEGFADRMGTP